ncbi:MAG TPA: DUF6266 family protein [Pseudosphingobacterium sp.]|nr:DUF6266 family protein [Pseudosphingobacterium sp.]
MAKFINGANGTFSGKVGSVIGSSWRGINYLRGLGKKSKVPATESQRLQRDRFSMLVKFIAPLKELLDRGFAGRNLKLATAFSYAVKHNMDMGAVSVTAPVELNYAALHLSDGRLFKPRGANVEVTADTLTVSWNPKEIEFNSKLNDVAHVLIYNVNQDLFFTPDASSTRAMGVATAALEDMDGGDTGHVWMFFTSADGKQISRTVYVGEVTFI